MTEESKLSADGLEVVGHKYRVNFMGQEFLCSDPKGRIVTETIPLCRLTDAQRLLAQWEARCVAAWEKGDTDGQQLTEQALEIVQLREELAHAEQWRDLAMQFDRHRMNAMALIKAVAAGKAGSAECEVFASVPPIPGHEITAEVDQLRARLAALESQQAASVGGVYSIDPLACSGCVSGCFRCRDVASVDGEREVAQWPATPGLSTRPSDDELWDQTLTERDSYHEAADKLTAAIAKHFQQDFGEHSNLNDPWSNALEFMSEQAVAALSPAGGGVVMPEPDFYVDSGATPCYYAEALWSLFGYEPQANTQGNE